MQVAEMENVADLGLGSNLNILLIQIYLGYRSLLVCGL